MSKPTPKFFLKVRSYAKGPFVTVWLIRQEGAAHSGLMWGEVLPHVVDWLAEATGLPVVRENSELQFKDERGAQTPPECATLKQQADLFGSIPEETP